MARSWLSIRVELVGGGGRELWPRPGRIFAAARSHTFRQFADAVDTAFARWDRAHLHQFTLADGTDVVEMVHWDGAEPEGSLDSGQARLGRLRAAKQFAYVFDLGDFWAHLCTVGAERIDPVQVLGIVPEVPLPYWGWGELPDQYGRRWDGDDGETRPPKRPVRAMVDLPPLLPGWGPHLRGR